MTGLGGRRSSRFVRLISYPALELGHGDAHGTADAYRGDGSCAQEAAKGGPADVEPRSCLIDADEELLRIHRFESLPL